MQISDYFPIHIKNILNNYIISEENLLEEIRFRAGNPIILKYANTDIILNYILKFDDILEILQKLCENSIYSYQSQICNAYITITRWIQSRAYW